MNRLESTAATADRTQQATTRQPAWLIVVVLVIGVASGVGLLFSGYPEALGTTVPMTALGIATLCYLAAAVTGVRWVAWLVVVLGTVLVFGAELLDVPRWLVIAAAGLVLAVVGVIRRPRVTAPQAVAMLAYFGVAVVALALDPRAGLAIAGLALAAHAGWDAVHYRRNVVVGRSLALWCMGLDLFLGLTCVGVALAA
ncbi:hypothetical protein PX701_11905 [Agromyces sp. H3Y2-19a]|uniref:hypothetical protein n=1 Tax=Agromyces chromiiresistens TaxID=3030835 RepID=UPI0023B9135F|nr:hypothetical protein [Agromyces chromiiresistens]MDF0514327.1 hypothetical protein [Agromyces chromiiresistens]